MRKDEPADDRRAVDRLVGHNSARQQQGKPRYMAGGLLTANDPSSWDQSN